MAVEEHPEILLYTRIRKSPYFYASRRHGVKMYSVYNHTYHPRHYGDPVAEYWHLLNGVTIWDVGVERQIEITGPDAFDFTNLIVARDMNKCAVEQASTSSSPPRTAGSSTTRCSARGGEPVPGSRSPTATSGSGRRGSRTTPTST